MSESQAKDWTHYSASDLKEADRLLDEHPPGVVAEKTGIPKATLRNWVRKGWVTKPDHRCGPRYDEEVVERADDLYDRMPLSEVSEVLDVPEGTLQQWAQKGWIGTDVNWLSKANRASKRTRKRARRAARLVYEEGLLQREAAQMMGVSQSSISRYLKMYRTGTYE